MLREVLRQLAEQQRQQSSEIAREKNDIERELQSIAQQIQETITAVGNPGSSGDIATSRWVGLQDRMSHLANWSAELSEQLAAVEAECVNAEDVEFALREFDPLWQQLSTWEQERFIRALV